MQPQRFILALLVLLTLFGCSTIQVNYDYDQEADFSAITTYSWRMANVQNDALEANPLLKKRVVSAVDAYLAGRGYTQAVNAIPDMYVVAHAGTQEKMRVTNWGGPGGYYGSPWYDPWWGVGPAYGGRIDVNYYTEGTLIIDIVDAKNKELIWRGAGTGIVKKYKDQEKMQQAINSYVDEILTHFPPEDE